MAGASKRITTRLNRTPVNLASGMRFIIPGMALGIFFSALFSYLAYIDGYGDLQLCFFYFLTLVPLFVVVNFVALGYSLLSRLERSTLSQFFLIALVIISLALAVAGSYLMKIGLGLHDVAFYQYPRYLAFLPAAIFFIAVAGSQRKSLKISVVGSIFALFTLWFLLSVIPISTHSSKVNPILDARPNILLITIESFRYDHLGKISKNRTKTENLDRLAAEGLFFSRYYVQAPYTTASLATLMTGLYPFHHGSRIFGEKPNPEFSPFPVKLKDIGYDTDVDASYFGAMFDTSPDLTQQKRSLVLSLWDKFTTIQYNIVNPVLGKLFPGLFGRYCFGYDTSLYQASKLMHRIRSLRNGRWFLWTHFDKNCHWPYSAPEHFLRMYEKKNIPLVHNISKERIDVLNRNPEALTDELLAQIDATYSAEVTCIDRQVGMILECLRRYELLDNTLVLITSDHGELLGEGDYIGHGEQVKEVLLHVPLILYSNSRTILPYSGERSDVIEEVDIAPTLLDVCNIEYDEGSFDGTSLLSLLQRDHWPKRSAYAEVFSPEGAQFSAAYKKGDFRLVWNSSTQALSLFNTGEDPGEREDIKEKHPDIVSELKEECLRLTGCADFDQLIPERLDELDAEMEERMRALGYIQ